MALTETGTLTQEVQDQIAAEMLIQPDDLYLFAANGPIQRADAEANVPGTNVINFNRPVLPTGTYTEASRRLTETTPISLTAIAISVTQVSLTTREYAGPHDGATVKPFGVTEFFKNRSKHNAIVIIGEFLRRDYNRFQDTTFSDLLLAATGVITPDGSAEGAIAAGVPASIEWLRQATKVMRDAKIPPFGNGHYRIILNTRDELKLKSDKEYRDAMNVAGRGEPLFSGHIGSFEGWDIMVSTMFATKAVGAAGAVDGYQSVMFGPYGLGQGQPLPVSVRRADDTDFGRAERVIWKSEEAIGTLYSDLIKRGITT